MSAQETPLPRIIAHFRPQEWVNDYAIDIDRAYDFDATDLLLSWPKDRVLALEDHDYQTDDVWSEHEVSRERPHHGPFEVEVVKSVTAFIEAMGPDFVWPGGDFYESPPPTNTTHPMDMSMGLQP
jgi:hypothetical protein